MWPTRRGSRLEPAEQALAEATAAEWLAVGLSTAPADREAAEAGVRLAYQRAGLRPPQRILWAQSPLAGAREAARLRRWVGNWLWDRVRATASGLLPPLCLLAFGAWVVLAQQPAARGGAYHWIGIGIVSAFLWRLTQLEAGLVPRDERTGWIRLRLRRRAAARVADQVHSRVVTRLNSPVADRIWSAVREEAGEEVAIQGLHSLGGPREVGRLAAHAVLEAAGEDRHRGLMQVARAAGCWWPFRSVAVLTERPVRLCLDSDGRLHAADGPAIVYPDGWAIWAWHGVRVPGWVICAPRRLTVAHIQAQRGIDVRRVMIERYGVQRYMRDAGARKVSSDEYGTLWRCPLLGDEPLVMVEVVNATPEPDGSFRNYWLRVPPDLRTPREAVAWTFGVDTPDYCPQVQT
ncbi:MAG: DUF6745 domain-containing protein [Egibacteraceae bacterium]